MTTFQTLCMYVGFFTLATLAILCMGLIAATLVSILAGLMERSVSEGKAMFIHFITLGGK